MRKHLSKPVIDALKAPEDGYQILWDSEEPGLGLRITAGGTRSFILNYRFQGRMQQQTLGRYPALPATAARRMAIELRGRIYSGQNPKPERPSADHDELRTLRDLAAAFLNAPRFSEKAPRTRKEYARIIHRNILPSLGTHRISSLPRREIESFLAQFHSNRPMANKTRAVLSAMFSYAMERELREDNPVRFVRRYREQPRERYLTEQEIGSLERVLRKARSPLAANAIRLLLLTGARKNEILHAEWRELNLEEAVLLLQPERCKEKRSKRILLSDYALEVIETLSNFRGGQYLFTGRAEGQPLQEIRKTWQTATGIAGISGASLHTCRHTFASLVVKLGYNTEIVRRLLGHSSRTITDRYTHFENATLREAVNKVGEFYRNLA